MTRDLTLKFTLGVLLLASSLVLLQGATTNTVRMTESGSIYGFSPAVVNISPGDAVRWTNAGSIQHDSRHVTNASQPTVLWYSGNLSFGGATFTFTFTNAGTYPYHCFRHRTSNPEQTGTVIVASMNLPPTVSLTNPSNNASLLAPATFSLQANATDDGAVTNVQFLRDAVALGDDTTAPFTLMVTNLAAGNYTFRAVASDNAGLKATSAPISVAVLTNWQLLSVAMRTNAQVELTVLGISNQPYVLDISTNLSNWTPLVTNVAPSNLFNYTDSTATNLGLRYYRVRQTTSP
jgi:plastocyanin